MMAEALVEAGQSARVGWLFGAVGLGIAMSGLLVRLASGCSTGRGSGWWLASSHASPAERRGLAGQTPTAPAAFWALFMNYTCEAFGYSIVATFIVAIVKARPGMEAVGDWVRVLVGLTGPPSCIFWSWVAGRIGFSAALALAYLTQLAGILPPTTTGAA